MHYLQKYISPAEKGGKEGGLDAHLHQVALYKIDIVLSKRASMKNSENKSPSRISIVRTVKDVRIEIEFIHHCFRFIQRDPIFSLSYGDISSSACIYKCVLTFAH